MYFWLFAEFFVLKVKYLACAEVVGATSTEGFSVILSPTGDKSPM